MCNRFFSRLIGSGRTDVLRGFGLRRTAALGAAALCMAAPAWGQSEPKRDSTRVLETVTVHDSRAGASTPLTTSNIGRQQLEEARTEVAVPFMLEFQPSVVVAGENGKLGETSMRIRGVDGTRINVNLNGVTVNDAESQTIFWYNVPNLGGMSQSMQIQRGLGAASGGSSLGGAINMQSLNASDEAYGSAELSVGSWNTRVQCVSAGTGVSPKGFALDLSYCGQSSDGFVQNGFADQQSLMVSGSYFGKRSLLKGLAIIGSQHTGITWNGETAEDLDLDPTYNSAGLYWDALGNVFRYGNECDFYRQRRYQLLWNFQLAEHWSLKAVGDFTHGDGYYEQYKCDKGFGAFDMAAAGSSDFVVRKEMLNGAYTGLVSAGYEGNRVSLLLGERALLFDGWHFGEVIWCRDSAELAENPFEWYRNRARKWDASSFAKVNVELSPAVSFYADLELRVVDYRIAGAVDDLFDMDFRAVYPFFNPKGGLNWRIDDRQRVYLAAGLAHREPARSDIKDAVGRGDTILPERMVDLELGYRFASQRVWLGANGYAMLYHDQLTPSGDLNSSGYALMENVEDSYRLGLELEAGWKPCRWLRLEGNATLSRNRIVNYSYTDFDDGDSVLTTLTGNTDLAYSPNWVTAAIVGFEPSPDWKIQLIGKGVGAMFMDNTSREVYKQPAYFVLNAKVGYTWHLREHSCLVAQLAVNNVLNAHYRLGAWCGDGDWSENSTPAFYHCCGWYQQPGRNWMASVALQF